MPPRLTQPFERIAEFGVTELVGADEQVDQNDYSASVSVSLGTDVSGEILMVTLYSRGGDVLEPNGTLYIFDADPAIANGDTSITAAERITVIAQIAVETTDWKSDANGASATIFTKPVAFHALDTLYLAWFHELATSLNSAAGDNETLEVNAWYRRDS
jgi:hypothetical protein